VSLTYIADRIACLPHPLRNESEGAIEVVFATDLGPGFELRVLLRPDQAGDLAKELGKVAGDVGRDGHVANLGQGTDAPWALEFSHFGW
jgi:hypothetical protein